jgi:squalene-hopene/tetraprenyl-beta-curcumene cyclase
MRLATLGVLLAAAAGAAADSKEDLRKTWAKGAKALAAKQLEDGSWSFDGKTGHVGATGLAVMALAGTEEGRETFQAQIGKGCDNLLANQGEGGEIHDAGQVPLLTNYKTAIAVKALATADAAKYKAAIDKAARWLRDFQYQPGGKQPANPDDPNFGGAGYDEKKSQPRGDLSNASYMLEALKAAGEPQDSETWKRAVKFVERCQNRSESNDGPGFDKLGLAVGDDGGFFYRPGESKAEYETLPNGKKIFRSYGSMSYAGLKSMIYAGLKKDDPRVKAVMGWIGKHYTLDENPGVGVWGMYYYYQMVAAGLAAYGEAEFTDADGEKHDWANELVAKLASLQHEDGTWSGDPKWMEDTPPLASCYCLIALGHAEKFLK